LTIWLCATCGLEYPDSAQPPASCAICSDDRQYVTRDGQRWTTLADLQRDHSACLFEMEQGLFGITVTPKVGIGHRSLLAQTGNGNVLWDPAGYLDDQLLAEIKAIGGLAAIACSHPHLTGLSVSYSHAFGSIPIWYAEADRRWVRRPDDVIRFWSGEQQVLPGLTLYQCGGHFPGSAVLHWMDGAGGKGAILTGDTIRVNADWHTVSFMRSFPNLIPLPPRSIEHIAEVVRPLAFDRIHGGFEGELIETGGHEAVQFSARRYIAWITDQIRDPDDQSA